MNEAFWIAIGVLLMVFAQHVVGTLRDTRPWPVERGRRIPRAHARRLRAARLELTARLMNRSRS